MTIMLEAPIEIPPFDPGWAELRLAAELFHRAQVERIAVGNTIRRAEQGGNLPVEWMQHHAEALADTEEQAKKTMKAIYRRVVPESIQEWQARENGIGEHMLARLLGVTGNPLIAYPHHWEGTGRIVCSWPTSRTCGWSASCGSTAVTVPPLAVRVG